MFIYFFFWPVFLLSVKMLMVSATCLCKLHSFLSETIYGTGYLVCSENENSTCFGWRGNACRLAEGLLVFFPVYFVVVGLFGVVGFLFFFFVF